MKTCKKCGKPLPDDHKGTLCEGCMGKRVQGLKDAGKKVLSVCLAIGGILAVLAGGGNNSDKES